MSSPLSRMIITLVLFLSLNFGVSFLFSFLIPNVYLARILSSTVLAFLYGIVDQWEDRLHFYRHQKFWYEFFIIGLVFNLVNLFLFLR